jgi:hypothetical protein
VRATACRLGNDGAGGRGLVLPGGGEDTDGLVVAGQAVNARLDENQAELGVLVLAVALKVLADGDGLSRGELAGGLLSSSGQGIARTFLMSMYRSSGISGARPVTHHSVSLMTKQRHSPSLVSLSLPVLARAIELVVVGRQGVRVGARHFAVGCFFCVPSLSKGIKRRLSPYHCS